MSTTVAIPFFTDPAQQKHLLAGEITVVGRAVENDIVVTSKRASREHARVRREGRRVVLEDLESTNGTFLNDERVLAPVELRDGDQVSVGDMILVFHDPDATSCNTRLPGLEIDLDAGVVRVNRRAVALSGKEYALLSFLYKNRGKVCSKDDICTAVWPEYQGGVYDYQVENLVRRLRSRLEPDPADPQLLITVRGLGYKLIAAGE